MGVEVTTHIVEFESGPYRDYKDGEKTCVWESTIAVDLRWVASVRRYDTNTCMIQMCGDGYGHGFEVNMPYETVFQMWANAKGMM